MSFFYKIKNQKILSNFLLVFLLAELLSFLAYNFSFLSGWFLGLIFLLTLALGFWQEKYLLYVPVAELFWGSLGHSIDYNFISLRLAIFIAVIFVFSLKYLFKIKSLKIFRDRPLFYLWFFILLLWLMAIFSSYQNSYNFQDIFLDANAYLFIFYLPIWYQVYQAESFEYLVDILKAAVIIVAIKTILVFNLFVQDYGAFDLNNFYKWIRDTRTGEITPYANNFFRVFFQSHFYLLIAFFALLMRQMQDFKNKNNFLWLSLISGAILISLSRSLWLGGGLAFIFLLINLFIYGKRMLAPLLLFAFALLLSSTLVVELVYNLPHYNSLNIFSYRSADTTEPAASSRLELLLPLWQNIKARPILGWGFAKELTYKSSDPRIKNEANPSGWYTSYTFEWGWLDMWLKAGIFMILAFILWLGLIFRRGYNVLKEDKARALFLLCSVVALIIIHIFSPYINHPLGLGLLMLSTIIFSLYAKKNQSYN